MRPSLTVYVCCRCRVRSRAGAKPYELHLSLYADVIPKPGPQVLGSSVSISLAKVQPRSWPRLLSVANAADKNKIKVDWERWCASSDSSERASE